MQHLLDFIHDHTVEDQIYVVVPRGKSGAELELIWKRSAPHRWQMRHRRTEEPWVYVDRAELLSTLTAGGADMTALEREFNSIIVTQVVFADMILTDARKVLGRDAVRKAVLGHRDFVGELRAALEKLSIPPQQKPRPSMRVISGGGSATEARSGHLSVVS